jgi:tetratricopeptide (TPR) repeat protein
MPRHGSIPPSNDQVNVNSGNNHLVLVSAEANFQKAETERQRAAKNLKLANEEQLRAEGNLDLALTALDAVYLDAIGKEKLLGKPLASPDQGGDAGSIPHRDLSEFERELLDRGLTFYAEFANRNRQTSRAEAHTARAYYRVALLQGALEERDSAEAAYIEAINRFKALIRNQPDNHTFHHELSQAYFGLERIQPKWKDAEREYSKADDAVTAAIRMKPDAAEYYQSRSEVRVALGDYRGAQQDAGKASELAPKNVEFCLTAARRYIDCAAQYGDCKRAILHCEQALGLEPNNAKAHSLLGVVLYYPDRARALKHLSRSIEIDPTYSPAFTARARIYLSRGDYERALSDANEAIRLKQGEGGYGRRAQIYIAMGRIAEAIADLAAKEERTPPGSLNYADLLKTRGRLHLQLRDYSGAVRDFTRAIEQRPLTNWLYSDRSDAYFHMGQYDKALEDIETALELLPMDRIRLFSIPSHLVATCPDEGFRDGLLAFAQETMKGCKSVHTWLSYADLLTACGHQDQAQRAYKTAAQVFTPDNTQPYDHYLHALLCLRFDDEVKYRRSCQTMLNQFADTDDPMGANFVAWICALAPDAVNDYEPVLACASKAVEARPDSEQFLNTLGAILYRAGRHDAAIERLTELDRRRETADGAVQSSPAYTWYFLAMAHQKAGHVEQAREYLNKANQRTDEESADKEKPPPWNRRATLELLRKEAEALLATDDPKSAKDDQKSEGEEK